MWRRSTQRDAEHRREGKAFHKVYATTDLGRGSREGLKYEMTSGAGGDMKRTLCWEGIDAHATDNRWWSPRSFDDTGGAAVTQEY